MRAHRSSSTLLLSFLLAALQSTHSVHGFFVHSSAVTTTTTTSRTPAGSIHRPSSCRTQTTNTRSRGSWMPSLGKATAPSTSTSLCAASVPMQMMIAATASSSTAKGMAVPNSIIKGRLTAFLSKFLITPTTAWHIFHRILATLRKDVEEIITIVIVYKFAIRIAQKIYQLQHKGLPDDVNEKSFQRSKTLRIARALKEVAQLFGLIIALEFGLVLLEELDFEFVRIYPVYQWTCSVIASIWGAKNLSEFKDFVISRGGRVDINKSAGRKLLSRFLDVAVYGSFTLVVLDFLSVQTGYALKSLFGLSSVGTLVFSLASKELVGEFLAGLAIQGTNMYTEGEKILLQDGTTGTVQKLGWLNTHLRQSDELVVRIPNTQISGKRVANISRSRLSSVKQALAISYEDVDKLPGLMDDIKTEIRQSCRTLVDDGSRGFTVFFSDYKDKSVTVSVSAYFRTRPFSEEYQLLKQDVLMAIRRATKKNDVSFSYVNWSQSGIPID